MRDFRLRGVGARGRRLGLADNRIQDELARRILGGPNGDLQFHVVGDNVRLRAAVNRADGDNAGIDRVQLAADNRLQIHDQFGGNDNRINRQMGRAPWPPLPLMTISTVSTLAMARPSV